MGRIGDAAMEDDRTTQLLVECLKLYGQRFDFEIADETGVAVASVRERLAAMTRTSAVIACKVTRIENGRSIDSCLYRMAGYVPPRAPGRKPTVSS
jgi:hypothetical protein